MELEEQEEEAGSGPGYNDSLGTSNPTSTQTKMPSPVGAAALRLRRPRYKECLKNHAVGIGGNAVDGCGEFMPAGEEGTLESLHCAACNCHRNFHRKENEPPAAAGRGALAFNQYPPQQQQLLLTHHHHHPHGFRGYLHVAPPQSTPPPLALPSSSGGGGGSGSRDENMEDDFYSSPAAGKNKRFRTRFTQEQKDKMLNLAERLDWKIQKQDEEAVQQFCREVGLKRHVLKVWMHNNKHTLGKKT